MRTLIYGVLCAGLMMPATLARADDKAAGDLLEKAIQAYGGAEKAAKLTAIAAKGKTTISEGGMEVTFTFDVSLQGFDLMKMEAEVSIAGQTMKTTMVLNGDKAWAVNPGTGKTEEAPKEVAPLMRQVMTALRSAGNPAGLKDKDIQLAHGGVGKIDVVDTEILRINRKDLTEITLVFDKKTGMPLKAETKIKEPNANEASIEFAYSDFKEVNGVKHPHRVKILRDGKDIAELELTEIKLDQKFDASTFEKP